MQQFLKSASGAARTKVVTAQLLHQFFVAVDDTWPTDGALDARLRGETLLRLLVASKREEVLVLVLFHDGLHCMD